MDNQSAAILYQQSKDAIISLVSEANQHANVPACPEWTIRDLLGHQVGVVEDAVAGNLDDLGQPHWTAAQVQRHTHHDLDGVKHAWDKAIARSGDAWPQIAEACIPDIAIHEFDIRGAVGNTEDRTSPIIFAAFDLFAGFLNESFREMNLPALRIVADDRTVVLGEGEPQLELRTSQHEFTRFVTGRRSPAQMRAMDWSGDSAGWLDHLSLMPTRDTDLLE